MIFDGNVEIIESRAAGVIALTDAGDAMAGEFGLAGDVHAALVGVVTSPRHLSIFAA